MFLYREIVRSGNSTAKVKNYFPETGLLVLMSINGSFSPGMVVTGDVSGFSKTLTTFDVNEDFDLNYKDLDWEVDKEIILVDEWGNAIIVDDFVYEDEEVRQYNLNRAVVQR